MKLSERIRKWYGDDCGRKHQAVMDVWAEEVAQLDERVRELSLLPEDAKRWLHAGDCTRINKQACTCGLAQYIHALGGEQLAKDNANELAQLEADIDYQDALDHQATISDARHAGCQ